MVDTLADVLGTPIPVLNTHAPVLDTCDQVIDTPVLVLYTPPEENTPPTLATVDILGSIHLTGDAADVLKRCCSRVGHTCRRVGNIYVRVGHTL